MTERTAWAAGVALAAGLFGFAASALAQGAGLGAPADWQLGFQDPASPVMADIVGFHNLMLWLITGITLFVLGLMLYIMYRFNAKSNPVPTKTTHNTMLEVLWTVIPVIILVAMAIPSFRLLYRADVIPNAERLAQIYGIEVDREITLKATGVQWAWEYSYPDLGVSLFSSCLYGPDYWCFGGEAPEGAFRLLETDNPVVVPVNTLVKVQVTAATVIHSWSVPAFGVKMDGVPGRINETWFVAQREGVYYGQCSELCGLYHSYMPIEIRVVSAEAFDAWVAEQVAAALPARRTPSAVRLAQLGLPVVLERIGGPDFVN